MCLKVSYIVPVYNGSLWLDRCVTSILRQTYRNLEVLIIDDGSTDSSLEQGMYYTSFDNRVKVFSQCHGGLSAARNYGLEQISGDIIGFVDIDDRLDKVFTEILVTNMTEASADISSCLCTSVLASVELVHRDSPFESRRIYSPFDYLAQIYQRHDINVQVGNKLYRRALFKDIRFPRGVLYEDVVTSYLLFRSCTRMVHADIPLYQYNTVSHSITRSKLCEQDFDLIKQWTSVLEMSALDCPQIIPLVQERMLTSARFLADKYLRYGGECKHASRIKKIFRANLSAIYKSEKMGIGKKISMSLGAVSLRAYGYAIDITRRGNGCH